MEIGNELCLYHLWQQLDPHTRRNDALEFLIRTCKIYGMDEKQIESITFIQASYGLWDKKPCSKSDISDLSKKIDTQYDKSCDDILSCYEKYHIKDVCKLCPRSSLYCNDYYHKELVVLRRLLSDFEAVCRGGWNIFPSVIRMSEDYAIGVFPVIPLHYYMYTYLLSFGMAKIDHTKTSFCGDFTEYLCNKILPDSYPDFSFDRGLVKKLVEREYAAILSIPLESVVPDVFDKYISDLKQSLKPKTAPVVEKPVSVIGKNTLDNDKFTQPNLLDELLSIENNTEDNKQDSMQSETGSLSTDVRSNHPIAPNNPDQELLSSDNVPIQEEVMLPLQQTNETVEVDDFEVHNDISAVYTDQDSNDEILSPAMKETKPDDNGLAESIDSSFPLIGFPPDESDLGFPIMDEKGTLSAAAPSPFFMCIPEDLSGNEVHVFSTRNRNYLSWLSGIWQSKYICIEPMLRYGREGLLLYFSENDMFFYYDLEIYKADILCSLISDSPAVVITFHTLDTYGLLYRYGYDHPKIQGIDVMADFSDKGTFPLCHRDEANLSFIKDYHTFFQNMYAELSDSQLSKYTKNLQIAAILSHNYILKTMCKDMPYVSVYRKEKMRFEFYYKPTFSFETPGVLFDITVPGLDISDIAADTLAGEVVRLIDRLHHSYRINSFILSIRENTVYLFFRGSYHDAMYFYDAYILAVMELYEKSMNKPMHSKTHCTIFGNKH